MTLINNWKGSIIRQLPQWSNGSKNLLSPAGHVYTDSLKLSLFETMVLLLTNDFNVGGGDYDDDG